VTEQIHASLVARWAESVAAIGRTGMAFSESRYDVERYEELLHIAADMLATMADEEVDTGLVTAAWRDAIVPGPAGYVTPKLAVGAFVGNERGELLLIQRSDNHKWFIPTGWADVGYSAAEVVVKELMEETGISAAVEHLTMVVDGMRGGSPVPHHVLVFTCKYLGGELRPHPLECDDVGWFAQDALPEPLFWPELWRERAFDAITQEHGPTWFDPPRHAVWRTSNDEAE
jgi:ADP-ribose pyrophosphatase YjhB (NUDIX family)